MVVYDDYFGARFVLFSSSMFLDDIYIALGGEVFTFLERAAYLVNCMFSLCFVYL